MHAWIRAAGCAGGLGRRWLSGSAAVAAAGSPPLAAAAAAAGSRQQPTAVDGQRVALVQGASRGLGLEFTSQLLQRPGTSVVATCRNPASATALRQLQAAHGANRLSIVRLDCTDEASIEAAAASVAELHPCLDLLVNTAGVLHSADPPMMPETALSRVSLQSLLLCHQINAFGPILVSKAMLPLLTRAAAAHGADDERPAVIANISARVGSIGDNQLGGWYSYRASKSSLNQLTKTMSVELARRKHKVAALLLHPGTVDTDLSKPFQRNVPEGKLFSREQSVRQLLAVIDGASMRQNGAYLDFAGKPIEW